MKKKLVLIISILTFIACDTASVDLDDDNYVFDGRGGIKCEVDGTLLIPSASIIYGNATLRQDSFSDFTPFLTMGYHNNNQSTGLGFQYIRILLYDVDSREDLTGQIYYLYDEENQESFGEYGAGNFVDGSTTTEYYGEVEIIYHDVDERILAGTFWYDVVNENGEIREVRNGEFDMTIW